MNQDVETFEYDDAIVRKFLFATIVWGLLGMLVGLMVALQLAIPAFNFDDMTQVLTFGRIRPLHTNTVIFAFAGNAIYCGIYYSLQRLLKARMFSGLLSGLHFWGWQLIIVAAVVTLPLGFTQGKEYAELEWPIDIAITVVWAIFAINMFGTIARRRERHLYVAIWFYIATVVTIALLHVFNSLVVPATALRSYSVYAGAQDAFMQWWYGHNLVAFFLTMPFLGMMYYFLPKAAGRPVYSYRLAILHFWTLVFLYIWAGPHHLHYTALPAWATTLGMLFSLMLWMPSWGGMINGLLVLRGAWHKVSEDPVLKFMVVALTFYGMATFEGPMMSIKSVNSLSHYTDWTIAHAHAGALGWVGFFTFGMIYWLLPRVFQARMHSRRLADLHFWIATLGILIYIVPIYAAGLTQGLMWRDFNEEGGLSYDFVETVTQLRPLYYVRVLGGLLYFFGAVLCFVNVVLTWMGRPKTYAPVTGRALPLSAHYTDPEDRPTDLELSGAHVIPLAHKVERLFRAAWHRRWERLPLLFTGMVVVAVVSASALQIVPTFALKSSVPTIASVKPYTPLELGGRDLYIANGCYNCHSQMVRPIWAETQRYGEYSKPGEFVYDHPFQWGSRRIGPDLHRIGGKYSHVWHVNHMRNPRDVVSDSIMPAFAWMLQEEIDFADIQLSVDAMVRIGVPYGEAEQRGAAGLARAQAREIGDRIVADEGPSGLENKKIVALIAYLQRLGTDIAKNVEASATADADVEGGK